MSSFRRGSRDYKSALIALNGLQKRAGAVSPRLYTLNPRDRMSAWLERLKIKLDMDFIHIAGTKGKGTTALYTEAIIQRHHMDHSRSEKIGCLTSPHISSVRERIRINSSSISENSFAHHFWKLWDDISACSQLPGCPPALTYPSMLTLLAFQVFCLEGVRIGIIEAGIGGETDSTNFIKSPIATGITSLDLDHTDLLGSSIEDIAWHKAGIFKRGAPAFSVPQTPSAARVLQARAEEKDVDLKFINDALLVKNSIATIPNSLWQRQNAALAVMLARCWANVDESTVSVVSQTVLPAKFEIIHKYDKVWILSSAHNNMSVRAASESLISYMQENDLSQDRATLIFAHGSRRDSKALLQEIIGTCASQVEAAVMTENYDDSGDMLEMQDHRRDKKQSSGARLGHAQLWTSLKPSAPCETAATVPTAFQRACCMKPRIIFVVGSTYLAGMCRHILVDS